MKRPGCTLLPASFRADADACESDDAESRPMTASGIQSSSCATEIPVRSSISASTCCGALRSFTRPCAACRPFFASFPRPCRTHSYGLPSDQIPSNSPTSPANHCSIMAGSDEKSATGGGRRKCAMAAWSTAQSWRVGTGARHRAQIRRVFWSFFGGPPGKPEILHHPHLKPPETAIQPEQFTFWDPDSFPKLASSSADCAAFENQKLPFSQKTRIGKPESKARTSTAILT